MFAPIEATRRTHHKGHILEKRNQYQQGILTPHGHPSCRCLVAPVPLLRFAQNNAEVVPLFLAGLCHPVAGAKTLTAKTLVALGLQKSGMRGDRCCALLQPPLLPALVAILGDSDTGAAQVMA